MSRNNKSRKYNVLGGVIAPSDSSYTIQGMPNPLLEKPKNPIDMTPPSMRFNGQIANLNNFNPYTRGLNVNINPQVPHESYKLAHQKKRFTTNVQLHGKPAMSPVLGSKR